MLKVYFRHNKKLQRKKKKLVQTASWKERFFRRVSAVKEGEFSAIFNIIFSIRRGGDSDIKEYRQKFNKSWISKW